MNSALKSILWFALAFLLPMGPVHAQAPNPAPKEFKALIDRFPGPTYIVDLHGNTIHYEEYRRKPDLRHDGSTFAKITPTADQWKEFRRTLDSLKVWGWMADYSNPAVADGITWRFSVSYPDHALNTEGRNNYPNETGALGRNNKQFPPNITPTETFDQLLAAIRKLIGPHPFR